MLPISSHAAFKFLAIYLVIVHGITSERLENNLCVINLDEILLSFILSNKIKLKIYSNIRRYFEKQETSFLFTQKEIYDEAENLDWGSGKGVVSFRIHSV